MCHTNTNNNNTIVMYSQLSQAEPEGCTIQNSLYQSNFTKVGKVVITESCIYIKTKSGTVAEPEAKEEYRQKIKQAQYV